MEVIKSSWGGMAENQSINGLTSAHEKNLPDVFKILNLGRRYLFSCLKSGKNIESKKIYHKGIYARENIGNQPIQIIEAIDFSADD